ncbi:hypothetical protein [Mesorhizobium sp. M0571]|uniref:hypothetical protein n=1 Tax=Mesorhizobium sp. M0571 TaxID=2956960 RepID=UPI0033382709
MAAHLNLYVNAADEEFLFTNEIDIEADEQRTSLAAQVGTAVADLIMQRMGFYWSANARELSLRQTGKQKSRKIPDFAYDPAEGHGFPPGSVVVVEAKGSLSKQRAKRGPIRRLARDAYNEQVRHMTGAKSKGLVVASGQPLPSALFPVRALRPWCLRARSGFARTLPPRYGSIRFRLPQATNSSWHRRLASKHRKCIRN